MALDPRDLKELTAALMKATEDAARGAYSRSALPSRTRSTAQSRSPQERQFGQLQAELLKTSKKILDLDKKQIETTKEGQKLSRDYNDALEDSVKQLRRFDNDIEAGGRSLQEIAKAYRAVEKEADGLSSRMAIASKNASQFSAALLQSHERIAQGSTAYGVFIDNMAGAASKLEKSYLEQYELIDETTKQLRKDLNPADYAKLRISVGKMQTMIAEQISGLGMNKFDSDKLGAAAMSSATGVSAPAQAALMSIAAQMQKSGLIGKDTDLSAVRSGADFAELAKKIDAVNRSLSGFTSTIDNQAKRAGIMLHSLTNPIGGMKAKLRDFGDGLISSAAITANATLAFNSAKKVYEDMLKFNISHLATSFMSANASSVKWGMSLDETIGLMQQNKRALGLYGSKGFDGLMGSFKGTFQEFGYTMKQGAEMIAPTLDAAISAGVNYRSADQLNKFMQTSMKAFQGIAGLVNISAAEYARLNAELASSGDIQETLLGLDKSQSELYFRSLEQQRNELAIRGLSIQQAQEAVKLQEAAKREKVSSRIRSGAMSLIQAQQFGMDPDRALRAMQAQMAGQAATAEQTADLNLFIRDFAAAKAAYSSGLTGTGDIAGQVSRDTFLEKAAGGGLFDQRVASAGTQEAIAQRANAGATAADARRVENASKANSEIALFGNTVNSVNSLIENNFTKTLGFAGLAAGGLAASSIMASMALGKLSAVAASGGLGSGLSDILGKGKGMLGGAGGLVGKLAAGAGIGSILGLGGLAASAGSEIAAAKGYEGASAGLGVMSSGLNGAAMGAGIGMLGGPLGAAIGGLIGTAGGTAYGLYKNYNASPVAPKMPAIGPGATAASAAVNTSSTASLSKTSPLDTAPIPVTDDETHQQLKMIADSMAQAVALLNQISTSGGLRSPGRIGNPLPQLGTQADSLASRAR